jgi:Ser/Thr protein kinase RdoA (MazF antagonist)
MKDKPPIDSGVFHSMISAFALKSQILPSYDIGEIEQCVLFARGINDSYLTVAGSTQRVLRLYRANWREPSQIEAEIRLLNRFAQEGLPVSVPIADRDGIFVHALSAPEGSRSAVLFSYAEGVPLDRGSPHDLALLGRITGELHLAAAAIPFEPSRPELTVEYLLERPLRQLRAYLVQWPEAFHYLQELAKDLASLIRPLMDKSAARSFCHGDLHSSNVHLKQRERLTVFDFDHCAYGPRCYEFASILRDIGGFSPAWDAFIDAYTAVRPLSGDEEKGIAFFWPVRAIWELGLQAELIGDGGYNRLMMLIDFEIPRMKQWARQHCGL